MRFSEFILALLIVALLTTSLADPLIDFFVSMAGNRDFLTEIELVFHLKDESGNWIEPEPATRFMMIVRNMSDYYFKLEKPDVFSGVEFIYFSESGRLYSGFNGKYTIDIVDLPREYMVNIVKDILDSLKEPLFDVMLTKKDGVVMYNFEYTQVMRFIIRRLRIEPIRVVAFVKEKSHYLEKIRFLGEDGEYVDINILKLKVLKDTSAYFKVEQGF